MEHVINGLTFDFSLEGPVIPVQIQINSGTVAAANTVAWPTTIAATSNFTTGTSPVGIQGMPHYAVGGVLTQAGTVTVQPYLDTAGSVPVGTATTTSITANTPFTLDGTIGPVLAQTIGVTIRNNGAVAATLTNPVLVLQST